MARELRENYTNDKVVIITAIISQMSCESVTAAYAARNNDNSRLILSAICYSIVAIATTRTCRSFPRYVVRNDRFPYHYVISRTSFLIIIEYTAACSISPFSVIDDSFIYFFSNYPVPRSVSFYLRKDTP